MSALEHNQPADGFFGRTLHDATFGPVRITERRHGASEAIPEHEHSVPYATFVLAGEYTETVGSRRSVLRPGSVLLHPARDATDPRGLSRIADRLDYQGDVEMRAGCVNAGGIVCAAAC